MAQVQLRLHIRWRWWVRPYVVAAVVFVWCMSVWMDEDDADALAGSIADFIVLYGLMFSDGS